MNRPPGDSRPPGGRQSHQRMLCTVCAFTSASVSYEKPIDGALEGGVKRNQLMPSNVLSVYVPSELAVTLPPPKKTVPATGFCDASVMRPVIWNRVRSSVRAAADPL